MTSLPFIFWLVLCIACAIAGIVAGRTVFKAQRPAQEPEQMTLNLESVLAAAEQLAGGPSDVPIDSDSSDHDDVNEILRLLEVVRSDLASRLTNINRAGSSVQRTSMELSQTSQDLYQEIAAFNQALNALSAEATEQANMANVVESGMENVSKDADEHQRLAQDADSTSEKIRDQVVRGEKDMDEVLAGWEQAISQLRSAGADIEAFEVTAREISSIVEIIAEISHRTNVLSLNASLEAERSGEEGEAFAVLATEIRSLSDNAKRQASDIDQLLQGFLQSQSDLLTRLSGGISNLDHGAQAIGTVRTSLNETVEGIELVALRIVRLARGFAQLSDRIKSLQTQTKDVSRISEKHAAVTKETVTKVRDRMLVGADQLVHEAKNLDRVSNGLTQSVNNNATTGQMDRQEPPHES